MKKMTKQIPGQKLHALLWDEDGIIVAQCLELDVASEGDTEPEALKNIAEAVDLYLDEGSVKLRAPSPYKNVRVLPFSYA